MSTEQLAASEPMIRVQRAMAAAGWFIDFVELNLCGERPKAEIKISRSDGRWLWARMDSLGRCSVETFHRTKGLGMRKNAGRVPLTTQIDDQFLGRNSASDPKTMLRFITFYVADNPAAKKSVCLDELRQAWFGLAKKTNQVLYTPLTAE